MLVLVGSLTLLVLMLVPGEAHAWGPVTHLIHGATVLSSLTTLPTALQEILRAFPETYLYGCVGADIIQAKKFTRDLRFHCHSWNVGWQVLEGARSDSERAFAYGYLTHLAADTYSHNYFVPLQLIVSFRARALKHVYWEARFDAMQGEPDWHRLREVVSRLHPDCDDLMERIVERTLFSFRTNKRIFNSVMALHRVEQWRRVMQRLGTRSKYVLTEHEVARYDRLCSDAALDMLSHGAHARCVQLDPTGREHLERAEQIRKRLQLLHRRRQLTPSLQEAILARVVPELKAHVCGADC
jgi:zinc dependent phospholipase C